MDGIQIFGDSKIIIDWDVDIHHIHSSYLSPWLRRVKMLIDSFQGLDFSHIFREQNEKVDDLSKKGKYFPSRIIMLTTTQNGENFEFLEQMDY